MTAYIYRIDNELTKGCILMELTCTNLMLIDIKANAYETWGKGNHALQV